MDLAIHPIDTAIILIYMSVVIALGMWVGRNQSGLRDYFLGGRDLPWWAVLGSIVATETSTATFLSVPGLAYAIDGDLRFLQLTLGFFLGRCCVALFWLPLYLRGELYSVYALLQQRFGRLMQRTVSLLFLVARNLGDGLRLYLTAVALQSVTNLPMTHAVILIGLCTLVYTLAGGMKSVIWNDCLQFVVYTTGGVAALFLIVGGLGGGWQEFQAFAAAHDKFRLIDLRFDLRLPFTFWSGVIGGMCLSLGTHGTDQMMVQRYLCARSPQGARLALVLSGLVVCLQFTLFLLVGIALACFYQHPPNDPFAKTDYVFAQYIVDEMPVGFVGLILAAVFAAAMSTLSSSLNSSATAALNDFLQPPAGASNLDADEVLALKRGRLLTLLFAVIQIVIGIGAQYLESNVVSNALAIAGFTAGILLGIFALGLSERSRQVGQRAALHGLLAGVAAVTLIKFQTPVAWPWYSVCGAVITFTAAHVSQRLSSAAAARRKPD